MGVYDKLSKIQSELFVPKGQKNNFGNYSYRSCEDILKAVKPLCEKNKCVIIMSNAMKEVGGRCYVEAQVTLIDLETNESVISIAHAREDESKKGTDGAQLTGACSSYSRKYALAGMFCIDNEKDADATNTHGKEDRISEDDVKKILLALPKVDMSVDDVCKQYGVKALIELNQTQYIELQKNVNDMFEKKAKEKK